MFKKILKGKVEPGEYTIVDFHHCLSGGGKSGSLRSWISLDLRLSFPSIRERLRAEEVGDNG